MSGHVSGVYRRTDRVRAPEGATVRVFSENRRNARRVRLVELGLRDLLLTGMTPPALGTTLTIAITLPGRYIEFEVPAVVAWHKGADFGVQVEHLTARQAYGVSLAIDLAARSADAKPGTARVARG